MMMSSNKAGERLGLKQEVVAALVRSGFVKGERVGVNYMIQSTEVEDFAKRNGVKTKNV